MSRKGLETGEGTSEHEETNRVTRAHLVLTEDRKFLLAQRIDNLRDGLLHSSKRNKWRGEWQVEGVNLNIVNARSERTVGDPYDQFVLGFAFVIQPNGSLVSEVTGETVIYNRVTRAEGFESHAAKGDITKFWVRTTNERAQEAFLELCAQVKQPAFLILEVYASALTSAERGDDESEVRTMYLNGLEFSALRNLFAERPAQLLGPGVLAVGYAASEVTDEVLLKPRATLLRIYTRRPHKYREALKALAIGEGPALRDLQTEFAATPTAITESQRTELAALLESLKLKGLFVKGRGSR